MQPPRTTLPNARAMRVLHLALARLEQYATQHPLAKTGDST